MQPSVDEPRDEAEGEGVSDTDIAANRRVLGISNTYFGRKPWLQHAQDDIQEGLNGVDHVVVVPYAIHDMDWYWAELRKTFQRMGVKTVTSPHTAPGDEDKVINDAGAIYLAGGNTGRLVANIHALKNHDGSPVDIRPDAARVAMVEAIRKKVAEGALLMGASAGLNIMGTDVRTTNDMQAAVQVMADGRRYLRIDALGIFPDRLTFNPHFAEDVPLTAREKAIVTAVNRKLGLFLGRQGETRTERIRQVLEMAPQNTVLALKDGAYVKVDGMRATLEGNRGGVIFNHGKNPVKVRHGTDLSRLLRQ